MSRTKLDVTLVVVRGSTPDVAATFCAGRDVAPMTLGTQGQWEISAAGVAPIHVAVSFDGETLFCASTPGVDPARLDGSPISTEWTRLPLPCTITFGEAILVASTSDSAPKNIDLGATRIMDPNDIRAALLAAGDECAPPTTRRSKDPALVESMALATTSPALALAAAPQAAGHALAMTVVGDPWSIRTPDLEALGHDRGDDPRSVLSKTLPYDAAELEEVHRIAEQACRQATLPPAPQKSALAATAQSAGLEGSPLPIPRPSLFASLQSAPPVQKAMLALLPWALALSGAGFGALASTAIAPRQTLGEIHAVSHADVVAADAGASRPRALEASADVRESTRTR